MRLRRFRTSSFTTRGGTSDYAQCRNNNPRKHRNLPTPRQLASSLWIWCTYGKRGAVVPSSPDVLDSCLFRSGTAHCTFEPPYSPSHTKVTSPHSPLEFDTVPYLIQCSDHAILCIIPLAGRRSSDHRKSNVTVAPYDRWMRLRLPTCLGTK